MKQKHAVAGELFLHRVTGEPLIKIDGVTEALGRIFGHEFGEIENIDGEVRFGKVRITVERL